MAINPKDLDILRPATSSVDRLKARKNRPKPWHTEMPIDAPETSQASRSISAEPLTSPEEARSGIETVLKESLQTTFLEHKKSSTEKEVEPKLSQSEDKGLKEVGPKLSQSRAKLKPEIKVEPRVRVKVEPQPEPLLKPKLSQTKVKVEPKSTFLGGIESLVGLQRNTLLFIYDSCRNQGSRVSPPITVQNAAAAVESTLAAVRKAIQRLEIKGFINRSSYKDGRGGWTCYELAESTYRDLLQIETRVKVEPMLSQTRVKVGPQPEPQPEPSLSSSSSDLFSNKDLTTTEANQDLWQSVTWQILAPHGFTETHLRQLQDSKVDPEKLQKSIEAFEFDLRVNKRTFQKGPVVVFMGIVRRGGEYAPPANFESEEDKLLRELVERKESAKNRKLELEKKALEFEFETWFENLSPSERDEIVPETSVIRSGTKAQEVTLKKYFQDKIWPELKAKLTKPGVEI